VIDGGAMQKEDDLSRIKELNQYIVKCFFREFVRLLRKY